MEILKVEEEEEIMVKEKIKIRIHQGVVEDKATQGHTEDKMMTGGMTKAKLSVIMVINLATTPGNAETELKKISTTLKRRTKKSLIYFSTANYLYTQTTSSPLVSGDSSSTTVCRRSSSDARPLLASTSSPVLDFVVFLSKVTGCSFSDSHPPPAVDFLLLACATAALLYLFRLAAVMLKDPETAFRASVLLCFNPASILYSSIYSESLYALFSVGGLYYLISDYTSGL
ncbi:hypothetical protein LWI29_025817 [Acer saccharum]|uniref:GPI mannosyltransferase 2 n=1 Tax=Acer saccharum TaxID=4024 RepID=A0AA39RSF9_ACESA|nr:hypothetical protein LWI29_025817 [Acer saccharum]